MSVSEFLLGNAEGIGRSETLVERRVGTYFTFYLLCSLISSLSSVFVALERAELLSFFRLKSLLWDELSPFWEMKSLLWDDKITFLGVIITSLGWITKP